MLLIRPWSHSIWPGVFSWVHGVPGRVCFCQLLAHSYTTDSAGVFGTLAGGMVLDRMGSTLRNALLVCSLGTAAGFALLVLGFALAPSFGTFAIGLAAGEFAMFMTQVSDEPQTKLPCCMFSGHTALHEVE